MILVIGDTSEQLAAWTIDKFGSGQLANDSNYNSLADAVYFTALGDLSFDQIKTLALSSDEIYFADDLPWLDNSALVKTNILCNHVAQFKPIIGFDKNSAELFLTVPVSRKYDKPTVWTIGCSHTKGIGLYHPNTEVYGKLLSDRLGMKWQNIAKSGTSTKWSLSHLMQAEIRSTDIVVWATTSAERIRVATKIVKDVLLAQANKEAVQYYTDEQILFEHLDYVNLGIKYLRDTNKKFVVVGLLSPSCYFNQIELNFSNYKEWCPTLDWNTHDFGHDNLHMGPIGHRKLAERIYNHIQLLEYDKSI